MPLEPGFSIFIPVYNEEALVVQNISTLNRFLEAMERPYEIIIGSNGSTDKTVALARQLCRDYSHIRFFHLPQKGVGAAFREGVKRAGYERIIALDMDLSINLNFIPRSYTLLDHYDMVVGSKITGIQRRSWIRKGASNLFIRLAKVLLHIAFTDYSIAAKAYRRRFAVKYLSCVDEKTFYVVEILYRACREGKRVTEIPVKCHDTRESRFNLIHEGCYKFGNLFRLWLYSIRDR